MEEPSWQQLETKYIRTVTELEAPFIGPVGYHKPRYIHSPYAGSKRQISYPVSVSRNNLLSTPVSSAKNNPHPSPKEAAEFKLCQVTTQKDFVQPVPCLCE